MLPNYLAIEGNIGAGKTTLARMLAEDYNRSLILESFADNPFLPKFYEDPERYAFPVELFFMTERHKQFTQEFATANLFTDGRVADYIFPKTLLFARNTLNEEEFKLFTRIFRGMAGQFPHPDLIVYLHRPVEVLQKNIARRGRSYELAMTDDYLTSVEGAYRNYFGSQKDIPVLIADVGAADFVDERNTYQSLVEAIRTAPRYGVTHTLIQ